MRKKAYLTKPNFPVKEFKVKDFKNITDYSLHVDLSDEVSINNLSLRSVCTNYNKALKIFYVGNKLFIYMSNNNIYQLDGYALYSAQSVKSEPLMIDIMIKGKKEFLVIESESAYVLKKNITFNFPYGTSIAKYDGRLFVAKDKSIYYSNKFNFTEYSTNIENVGFLSVDDASQTIQELISFNDCLYVVCTKAIFKLTITNDEFSFNKCETIDFSILEGSAKKVGNKIYFISRKGLHSFDGITLKRITGEFDRFLGSAEGRATFSEEAYSIKIQINSNQVYFVYNTLTGKHHYIWDKGESIVGDNGYVFFQGKKLFRLDYNANRHKYCWYSKALDFSTSNKKRVKKTNS